MKKNCLNEAYFFASASILSVFERMDVIWFGRFLIWERNVLPASKSKSRSLAIFNARSIKRESWLVKAFVEQTLISGPALSHSVAVADLESEDLFTLQSAITGEPESLASFTAASVSAVSPDWLIAITKVFGEIIGARYLNSDAISTSVGVFA